MLNQNNFYVKFAGVWFEICEIDLSMNHNEIYILGGLQVSKC